MTHKEQITKIKEYADLADASYAMLHYIEENEEAESWFDEKLNLVRKPPSRWIYADGIKRGYEIQESNLSDQARDNHRSLGQPTAYALAIEARFSEEKLIKPDKNEEPKKIDNKIQNFIERKENNPTLENQKIKVSITKEKMTEEESSHYLSTRTKAFTSRYEVIEHQKNTSYGFSATLFKDCENSNQLILVCRGSEPALEDFKVDITLAQGDIPLQCFELAKFYEEKVKHHLGEEEKLLVIGHSLGGYLAQSFALMYPHRVKELYTFNAPGVLVDWSQDFTEIALDTLELLTWFIPFGFAGKVGWKILSSMGAKRFVASILGYSVSLKISKTDLIPQELQINQPAIQILINNILSLKNNPNTLPPSLENAKILHIETTNTLDIQKHMNTWLSENTTQHLGKDIKGKYLFLYVSEEGLESHYLGYTLRILYFYDYLLALASNEKKVKDLSFNQGIEYLNSFIKNIDTLLSHPLSRLNEKNEKNFGQRNGPFALFREEPEEVVLLSYFFSNIAFALHKSKTVLIMQGESYYTTSLQPYVDKGSIINFILELLEENIYIKILELEDFKKIKDDCDFLKTKEGSVYKACLAQYQNFIITNKEDQPIQTQEELLSLYGYNSRTTILLSRQWDESFTKSVCKSIEGLYFGGGVKILIGAER